MYTQKDIETLLQRVASGELTVERAVQSLRGLPFESTRLAKLDHHRQLRDGLGEVVYCEGKTAGQVADIVSRLAACSPRVLATRATVEQFRETRKVVADASYHEEARAIWIDRESNSQPCDGAMVVAAGTSDVPVAEEAALTLRLMGHEPLCVYDVGVAGLSRLLHHVEALQSANVIVAVAGMEGALPSVIGGLVSAPVVAVPTSIGYGVGLNGLAALLAMLNTCAAGVTVVNIDNGFGAGYFAATVNRKIYDAGL